MGNDSNLQSHTWMQWVATSEKLCNLVATVIGRHCELKSEQLDRQGAFWCILILILIAPGNGRFYFQAGK
jgi:hypothetical protein